MAGALTFSPASQARLYIATTRFTPVNATCAAIDYNVSATYFLVLIEAYTSSETATSFATTGRPGTATITRE